ncbi:hypothetical protein Scep_027792 [Stephania cephalantha]|uniref:Uncharacterized protein n=1 Tax=Stephania cephalantha TaxID=152367 RepID=A0AAP0HMV6_9MAGN
MKPSLCCSSAALHSVKHKNDEPRGSKPHLHRIVAISSKSRIRPVEKRATAPFTASSPVLPRAAASSAPPPRYPTAQRRCRPPNRLTALRRVAALARHRCRFAPFSRHRCLAGAAAHRRRRADVLRAAQLTSLVVVSTAQPLPHRGAAGVAGRRRPPAAPCSSTASPQPSHRLRLRLAAVGWPGAAGLAADAGLRPCPLPAASAWTTTATTPILSELMCCTVAAVHPGAPAGIPLSDLLLSLPDHSSFSSSFCSFFFLSSNSYPNQ